MPAPKVILRSLANKSRLSYSTLVEYEPTTLPFLLISSPSGLTSVVNCAYAIVILETLKPNISTKSFLVLIPAVKV